jgi:uncharacterized protein
MAKFIGRQHELNRLRDAMQKRSASLIVIKGRRRIGKSRLVEEFSQYFEHFYSFSGLPPTKTVTHDEQLNEFSAQIAKNFHLPFAQYTEWNDALWAVAERVKVGKTLLLFDEISWMGSKEAQFLGKIKNIWDLYFKKNDQLIFIICGSASSWIEKNIMSSTGFVGRISFSLRLAELSLQECNAFWDQQVSSYEKCKVLAVTGGVPKYLEEINPKHSAEENIKKLCFMQGGMLVEEYRQIFSDIFLRDSELYKRILSALSKGAKEQKEIQQSLGLTTPGRIAEYLWELELAGFVARDYTWNFQTGLDSKLSRYRLQDNYIRFYLKYIEKNLSKINRDHFTLQSLSSLPEWASIMGLQFENLVLNNRKRIHQLLSISPEDIICENPYFQRGTRHQKGCQIDYLIQTKFDTLYVCEIKFSKNKIGSHIVDEIQAKIDALRDKKRFSCRPVLIHVNGVTADLVDSGYFAAMIDVSALLL